MLSHALNFGDEIEHSMNDNSQPKPAAEGATAQLPALEDVRIGIIGLGYVGLPLAVYMGRHFPVTGFDINKARVNELSGALDRTGEVTEEEFEAAKDISFTADIEALKDCNFFIVTVPTPIDPAKRPDLTALMRASEAVGRVLSPGDIVVYESTVYPGATEEVCVPILERVSGLVFNRDFFAGYSPERINPGDLQHRVPTIVKVTSGSTPQAAELVDKVYGKVITAGTHKVSSIRVAEAAKVIENIQRDVNIALINEFAMLFKELGLDTREVLGAAGTKWNFHAYRPGLVGGHCIGVDPYYLTHKAQSIGFHPEMILAGRRINDGMAGFVARDVIKAMLKRKLKMDDAKVLVMGFTFKENVPDTRNTKVADLVRELASFLDVAVYDPVADRETAHEEYGIDLLPELPNDRFQAVILAVKHRVILGLGRERLSDLLAPGGLIYDVTGVLAPGDSDARI
jgi:UDP-N-acetyl-D-galactosamine dehydrogenase